MRDPQDLAYHLARWNTRWQGHYTNRREDWDDRAGDWERKLREKGVRQHQGHERVLAVTSFLRQRGVLGPDADVVDVGCGPGRFAVEFARCARRVVGLDFSGSMIEAGNRLAREQGRENASFRICDLQQEDPALSGFEGAFDLAFSSITPAIAGVEALKRFMGLSRAWCMNISFVHYRNDLHDRIMEDLFGRAPRREHTGHSHWFFELFNLLWCWGYYPETAYWDQPRELMLTAGPELADHLVDTLLFPEDHTEENRARIELLLRKHADVEGLVKERSFCRYGWTLWDLRARMSRP